MPELSGLLDELNSIVDLKNDAYYKKSLKNHYLALKLLEESGDWLKPLKKHSPFLLSVDKKTVKDFISEIVELANRNDYVKSFVKTLSLEDVECFDQKEIRDEIPNIVLFALALEKINLLLYEDYELIGELVKHFKKSRKLVERKLPIFLKLKLRSLEKPIFKVFIDKREKTPKLYYKFIMIWNILEASLADFVMGNVDNSIIGLKLSKKLFRGTKVFLSGNAIGFSPRKAKKWIDLYQTWNFAFVSQGSRFPYAMCKLLIPSVANYQEFPERYVYLRALSLYVYCNYEVFKPFKPEKGSSWSNVKFTRKWGLYNRRQAYERRDWDSNPELR